MAVDQTLYYRSVRPNDGVVYINLPPQARPSSIKIVPACQTLPRTTSAFSPIGKTHPPNFRLEADFYLSLEAKPPSVLSTSFTVDTSQGHIVSHDPKLDPNTFCSRIILRGPFEWLTVAVVGTCVHTGVPHSAFSCIVDEQSPTPRHIRHFKRITSRQSQLHKKGLYKGSSDADPYRDISLKFARKTLMSQSHISDCVRDIFAPLYLLSNESTKALEEIDDEVSTAHDYLLQSNDLFATLIALDNDTWLSISRSLLSKLAPKLLAEWKLRQGPHNWKLCHLALKLFAKIISFNKLVESFLDLPILEDILGLLDHPHILPTTRKKIMSYIADFTSDPRFVIRMTTPANSSQGSLYVQYVDPILKQYSNSAFISPSKKDSIIKHFKAHDILSRFFAIAIEIVNLESPNSANETAARDAKLKSLVKTCINSMNEISRIFKDHDTCLPQDFVRFLDHNSFFEALTLLLCSTMDALQNSSDLLSDLSKRVSDILLLLLSSEDGVSYLVFQMTRLFPLDETRMGTRQYIWSEVPIFIQNDSSSSLNYSDRFQRISTYALVRRSLFLRSEWLSLEYGELLDSYMEMPAITRLLNCVITIGSLFSIIVHSILDKSTPVSAAVSASRMILTLFSYDKSVEQIICSFVSHNKILPHLLDAAESSKERELYRLSRELISRTMSYKPDYVKRPAVLENYGRILLVMKHNQDSCFSSISAAYNKPTQLTASEMARILTSKIKNVVHGPKARPSLFDLGELSLILEIIMKNSDSEEQLIGLVHAFHDFGIKNSPVFQRTLSYSLNELLNFLTTQLLDCCDGDINAKVTELIKTENPTVAESVSVTTEARKQAAEAVRSLIHEDNRRQLLDSLLDSFLLSVSFTCHFAEVLLPEEASTYILSSKQNFNSRRQKVEWITSSLLRSLLCALHLQSLLRSATYVSYIAQILESKVVETLRCICDEHKPTFDCVEVFKVVLQMGTSSGYCFDASTLDNILIRILPQKGNYSLEDSSDVKRLKQWYTQLINVLPEIVSYLLYSGSGTKLLSVSRTQLLEAIEHIDFAWDFGLIHSVLQALLLQLCKYLAIVFKAVQTQDMFIQEVVLDTCVLIQRISAILCKLFSMGRTSPVNNNNNNDNKINKTIMFLQDQVMRPTVLMLASKLSELIEVKVMNEAIFQEVSGCIGPCIDGIAQDLISIETSDIVGDGDVDGAIKTLYDTINLFSQNLASNNNGKHAIMSDLNENQAVVIDLKSLAELNFPPMQINSDASSFDLLSGLSSWNDGAETLSGTAPLSKVYTGDDFRNVTGTVHTTPISKPGKQRLPSRHVDAFETNS